MSAPFSVPRPLPPYPALLDGVIDYAGLFPPAALDLDAAAAQFTSHLDAPEAWMLGRFVVPVASALDLAGRLPKGRRVELAVLGTGGDTPDAFLNALDADLAAITALHRAHGHVRATVYEVRFPGPLVDTAAVRAFLVRLDTRLFAHRAPLQVFFELPVQTPNGGPAVHAWSVLRGLPHGVKFRTGGLTADAFPSPGALAWALASAVQHKLPFKCTAGLHHPVRMYRDEVKAPMHGFLNVFGGAALLHAKRIQPFDLPVILADEDPAAWGWADGFGLRYRSHTVDAYDVRRARGLATGFGSCSFDEPVDDLRAMGLLASGR